MTEETRRFWEMRNRHREFWGESPLPEPAGGFAEEPPARHALRPVPEIKQHCVDRRAMRDRIVDLFRGLEGCDEIKLNARLVDQILLIVTMPAPKMIAPSAFRRANRATTRRELDRATALAEALMAAIRDFHEPAIVCLADRRLMRSDVMPALEKFVTASRNADLRSVPEHIKSPGRPPKQRATLIAALAVRAYEQSTSKDTRLPGEASGLVAVVRKIFKLTGVRANAKAAIAAALKLCEQKIAPKKLP